MFHILDCGVEIKWAMIIAVMNARNLSNCVKKPEKVRTSTGFEPVTSRYRCDALTNWAMKPLTFGAGHLWLLMSPWRMDLKWCMKCFIYWTAMIIAHLISTLQYMKHFIYHFTSILHGLIRTHKWPSPNVSGFIAQLVRASHRYREVTGSNPVKLLTFSGFYMQLLKLR